MFCSIFENEKERQEAHLARDMDRLRCLAPLESAVMKGRLMSVLVDADNSHFAFSAASLSRWTASLSFAKSMPCTVTVVRIKNH